MYNSYNSVVDEPPKSSNCSDIVTSSEQPMCKETEKSATHHRHSRTRRSLNDLNLMDSFLFSASTERIQDAEVIARIIVERVTGRKLGKVIIETEKQLLGIDAGYRGVRLDLCISELDNERIARVYDIEPNNYDLHALPKRERYNQAVSDIKLLETKADFRDLPEHISMWILPDDPFGADRMIYTVKKMVVENNKIVYNDGVMRLFLNARGTKGGTEALRALLNYFVNSCKANAIDSDLEKLHNIVTDVKCSREVGERYMTLQDYADFIIEQEVREGVKAGIEEALEEALKEVQKEALKEAQKEVLQQSITILVRNSINLGATKEKIVNILMKDYLLTEEDAKAQVNAEWCE